MTKLETPDWIIDINEDDTWLRVVLKATGDTLYVDQHRKHIACVELNGEAMWPANDCVEWDRDVCLAQRWDKNE